GLAAFRDAEGRTCESQAAAAVWDARLPRASRPAAEAQVRRRLATALRLQEVQIRSAQVRGPRAKAWGLQATQTLSAGFRLRARRSRPQEDVELRARAHDIRAPELLPVPEPRREFLPALSRVSRPRRLARAQSQVRWRRVAEL